MDPDKTENTAKNLAETLHDLTRAEVVELLEGHAVVVNEGQELLSIKELLAEYALGPDFLEGTSVHQTIQSLTKHVKRWARGDADGTNKTSGSAAFCNLSATSPSITVVYDYATYELDGETINPRRKHVARYDFPLSDAWKRWSGAHSREMSLTDFATLLEDRIGDVAEPSAAPEGLIPPGMRLASPAVLLRLAEGLAIRVESQATEIRRRDDGTAILSFREEHTDGGGNALNLPNGFLLALPVFVGGAPFAIPARLRYRVSGGKVLWTIALVQHAEAFRRCVTEVADTFANEASVDLFYGTPEASAP